MNCRDFERTWNDLIDAEGRGGASGSDHAVAELERRLLEHGAGCPVCGPVSARYQSLRRAIQLWGVAPATPAGLADRILAQNQISRTSGWPVHGKIGRKPLGRLAKATIAAFAAGVAAAVIILPMINRAMIRAGQNGPPPSVHITPSDPRRTHHTDGEIVSVHARALNSALAEATAATWDLARSASEPAARISRQVLEAATSRDVGSDQPFAVNDSGSVAAPASALSLESLAPDPAAAAAMLQQVGDRLTTGVRPFSQTARHAFGFLLGPAVARPGISRKTPAQKGA